MASKSVRIDEEAYKIALQYGRNLSEAVRTMDRIIRNLKEEIAEKVREIIREELERLKW